MFPTPRLFLWRRAGYGRLCSKTVPFTLLPGKNFSNEALNAHTVFTENTYTYTWVLLASSWHGNSQKHTKVSVGFKFIFNHIKSNLENWCMEFSESPDALYKIANALRSKKSAWHGWYFTTTVKAVGFLRLEWMRCFKIYKNVIKS